MPATLAKREVVHAALAGIGESLVPGGAVERREAIGGPICREVSSRRLALLGVAGEVQRLGTAGVVLLKIGPQLARQDFVDQAVADASRGFEIGRLFGEAGGFG